MEECSDYIAIGSIPKGVTWAKDVFGNCDKLQSKYWPDGTEIRKMLLSHHEDGKGITQCIIENNGDTFLNIATFTIMMLYSN
jgi:hypothetical protein